MLIVLLLVYLTITANAYHKKKRKGCDFYKIQQEDITYFPLPTDMDTSNRDFFPDPDTYKIKSISLTVCPNNDGSYSSKYFIKGTGFPLFAPTTVWQEFGDISHPIFSNQYSLPFIPVSSTKAAFNNGRNVEKEVNVLEILNEKGDFKFTIKLDYNPLLANQAPLQNHLNTITQSSYCNMDHIDGFNLCQKTFKKSGKYTNIGMEYLRQFNDDGSPVIDDDGNALIVRSPSACSTVVLVTHLDLLSHGIEDGQINSDCESVHGTDQCNDIYMLALIKLPQI